MGSISRICITNTLTGEDLDELIQGKRLALVIENYYPAELCKAFCAKILENKSVEPYTHEIVDNGKLVQQYFGVDRLGFPLNLTYNHRPESEITQRYYEEAQRGIQSLRRLCAPALTPIDKLRLELDERFRHGATVAAFHGRKMLAGVARVSRSELSHLGAEQPHFDALPESYAKLDSQLAANVYLSVPDQGGELELWDVPAQDPLSAQPRDWRAVLPASIKLKPKLGDLVLFNCRRPHAVCSFSGSQRVTMQVFIGYQRTKALQLWN